MLKRVTLFILIVSVLCGGINAFCYERDERRALEKIEELILREKCRSAERRCDRFLHDYKRSRLRKRVEDLKRIALKKIYGDKQGEIDRGAPEGVTYYLVQVGYFKKRNNARKLKNALLRKGFDAAILEVKEGRKTFYRVMAGKFRQSYNAQQLVKRLEGRGYTADIVKSE